MESRLKDFLKMPKMGKTKAYLFTARKDPVKREKWVRMKRKVPSGDVE